MVSDAFISLCDRIRATAKARPEALALIHDAQRLSFGALDQRVDQVAASFQRDGLAPGDAIALCASTSLDYIAIFLGALRAGLVVVPLPASSARDSLARMIADCGARHLFVDALCAETLGQVQLPAMTGMIVLGSQFSGWLVPETERPHPVAISPSMPFNIIYSSGTTGTPKGIVQSHAMRQAHIVRGMSFGYGPQSVTLLSTPLYSNTTLVSLLPSLALGGTAILMGKFNVPLYLELARRYRVTHTMLVPVQIARLMDHPNFDAYDLSSFVLKTCTSAPFPAALKAQVLDRWPGGLIEIYGMTEGGGSCLLAAHHHRDKLHTVGTPAPGHDIRVIDEDGRELERGSAGEIVGRSAIMMSGYHNRPAETAAAIWTSPEGLAFVRTGDIGRFDGDGFLELIDRKKDMIISGGFNIYPSDLEHILRQHPKVAEAAVVGVPSARWGETPVAFVVLRDGGTVEEVQAFANARAGKTQRLAGVRAVPELPRSPIGKILKRDLRNLWLDASPQ
ncbi:MAG: acyl--CoA ligase [Alphaproteobacteria bacterium]|nr:acyl--CoA ligase [Alphaproteobacteria bacterium]